MNQILVTEKVIVTKEMRKKKKFYKRNFFLSIFLTCILFSYYVYAEYDRNKYEQQSHDILNDINIEVKEIKEDTTTMDNSKFVSNSAIRVEDDILKVVLGGYAETSREEIKLGSILKDATQAIEGTQTEGNQEQQVHNEYKTDDGKITYTVDSIIKIPKIGIEYPVLSETSEELLKISVNKIWGSDANEVGNYVVAGHNYKSGKMFGKLKSLSIGDIIELTDLKGRTVKYVISNKYIIEEDDTRCTSQLTNGKKQITLITCSNGGTKRLVVQGFAQE